jgi:predicted amidohydrolase YtcJ
MMFSSHNDPPIVLPNAIRLMWTTVNRRTRTNQILGEDQCISPLEALKSITIWAAYQLFEESSKGSIEPGKLADFTILSANLLTVDPMTIRDIEVVETIKEGKSIYKAGSSTTS